MQRWTRPFFLATCLCLFAFGAAAQGLLREAPKDVRPAIIAVSATPPVITVNGQPDRFSPGVRIRDLNNMLVLTGGVAGQTLYTVYRRDPAGLVHEVWLLSAEEYRKIGGTNVNDPNSFAKFIDLLAAIFLARAK